MKRSVGRTQLIIILILMMILGTMGTPAFAVMPVWDAVIDFEALPEGPIGLIGTPSTEDGYDFFFVGFGENPVISDAGGNKVLKDPFMNMTGSETVFVRQGGGTFYFESLKLNDLIGSDEAADVYHYPIHLDAGERVDIYAIEPGNIWHESSHNATSKVFDTITSDELGITGIAIEELHINIVSISHDYSVDDIALTLDAIPPEVTATPDRDPNINGWYNGDVTVHFDATDDNSGVDESTITPDITLTTEGQDQLVEGTAYDNAGNMGTGSILLSIDKTPPTVEIASTEYTGMSDINLGFIAKDFIKDITYGAWDDLSGLTGEDYSVASGTFHIPTDAYGLYQEVSFDVYDNAGNMTTLTFHYNVLSIEDMIKLMDPVFHKDVFKQNSNIPVKLQILVDNEPQMMSADDLTFCLQLWKGEEEIQPTRTNHVSELENCVFVLSGPDYVTYHYNLNTKGLAKGEYTMKIYVSGMEGVEEEMVGEVVFTIR